MKNLKRSLFCFISLILCFSLSGCSLTDCINSAKKNNDINSTLSTVSDDSNYAMSKSTYKAQTKLVKATNKLSTTNNDDNKFKNFFLGIVGMDDESRAERAYEKASATYKNAKKTDKTYQKSVEEAKNANQGQITEKLKKYLPVILVVIVVIIVLLLLMKKRKEQPEQVVEPAVQQQNPTEQKVVIKDANRSGQLSVNYERLLQSNCQQLGIDYNQALQQYGQGDVRRAVEATQLLVFKR